MRTRLARNGWLFGLLLILTLPVQAETFTFSVVPQFSASETYKKWKPVLGELSRRSGYQFELKIFNNFSDFEKSYLQGHTDFVYYNPYHQVKGYQNQGYLPLIRDSRRKLVGIIVVQRDSEFQTIEDLHKKRFSFPAPNAFAASLYMRALLSEQEKISYTVNYSGSHSNGYREVLSGRADAAGGVFRTLNQQPASIRNQLRVIYQTPANPAHPIAAHKRINKEVRKNITHHILAMANEPTVNKLLGKVQIAQPMLADNNKDYLPLNTMGLEKYYLNE